MLDGPVGGEPDGVVAPVGFSRPCSLGPTSGASDRRPTPWRPEAVQVHRQVPPRPGIRRGHADRQSHPGGSRRRSSGSRSRRTIPAARARDPRQMPGTTSPSTGTRARTQFPRGHIPARKPGGPCSCVARRIHRAEGRAQASGVRLWVLAAAAGPSARRMTTNAVYWLPARPTLGHLRLTAQPRQRPSTKASCTIPCTRHAQKARAKPRTEGPSGIRAGIAWGTYRAISRRTRPSMTTTPNGRGTALPRRSTTCCGAGSGPYRAGGQVAKAGGEFQKR